MTSITLTITGAKARAAVTGPLTSGMVGIPVTINYDDSWEGLTKNLVCRCSKWSPDSGETRTVLGIEASATVAHEVMQAGMQLYLGVEGYGPDRKLVIPTIWAQCGKIHPGANSDADPSADPKLSVWAQIQADVKMLGDEVKILKSTLSSGNADISSLTNKEKSLMLTLFKNMLSQSNMSDTVNELEKIWTSGDTGEEEPDTPEESQTYTVAYYLDNVVSSNSATTVTGGNSFTATLEAAENYVISNVSVTMGGVDMTDSVYADGVITIASVTGNIIINATATAESVNQTWEDGIPYEFIPIENEYFENGAIKQYTGWARTDYLPCAGVARLNFSGNKYRTGYNGFFDINKTYLGNFDVETTSTDVTVPENAAFFMYSANSESVNLCVITPYASL